jgi:hypothetical protein
MAFRMSSGGGANAGSATITNFDNSTKVVTVSVRDQTGAPAANGTPVDVYVDGGGSPYASGTVAGGVGVATITLTGLSSTVGHAIVPKATLSVVYTGSGLSYVPVFGTASFTGTQAIKKTTGGLNPTGDVATATLTVASGVVTGVSASTAGANYDPLSWQTVTASGGNTTAFRGQVQAKTDGTLDWTTLSFTGTGHDGIALNAGAGYSGSTSAATITRKSSVFLLATRIRSATGWVNGEYLFSASSSFFQSVISTSIKPSTYWGSGPQYRAAPTNGLPTTESQDLIQTVDLRRAAATGTPPGHQIWLNNANNVSTPNNYVPLVDGTATGWADMSNTNCPNFTIGAHPGLAGNFMHADVDYIYIAWGMRALDSVTGQVLDLSSQTVRDRFLPGNINLADGTGATGRGPQIFFTGDSLKTGTNLGVGGNFGSITGTF